MALALRQAAAIVLLASVVGLALGLGRGTLNTSSPVPLRPVATPAPSFLGRAPQKKAIPPAPKTSGELSPLEAQRLLASGAVALDARRPEDYAAGHIPGAINLPAEEFDRCFPDVQPRLSPAVPLVLYCGGEDCSLSHELAAILHPMGFQPKVLRGGIEAWTAAGLRTER
ncbi:MAG: rhodanese-like domain-containing protein [Pseudomonadota bacterium]